jgi:predicted oxidoreductase
VEVGVIWGGLGVGGGEGYSGICSTLLIGCWLSGRCACVCGHQT